MNFKQHLKGYFAIMLLAAVYACNEPDSQMYVGTALDPLTDPADVDTTKFNAEYLHYSTVKINGVLPLESKAVEFFKVVGKPDSIVDGPKEDCPMFDVPYKELHFQECLFYMIKDTAIFNTIDFRKRPDLELTTPAITLNNKTTLQDVENLYPKSVRKARMLDIPGSGLLMLVDIGASKPIEDGWWILFFDKGKLVMAEMFLGGC